MSEHIYIQIIGIIGFSLGVSAYLSKSDNTLKALISIASFVMAFHFYLLGAYVGAGAALFSGLRSGLSIFQKAKILAPLFFLAYAPLAYFGYENWIDVFPLLAGLIGTYAMFYLEKIPMRYMLFIGTSFWLLHNILQFSLGGILLEGFYLTANALTIIKLKKASEK